MSLVDFSLGYCGTPGTTLVDNALLLHDPDSVNRMIVTLIELKSPIHFRAVNLCIGANQPALMASANQPAAVSTLATWELPRASICPLTV